MMGMAPGERMGGGTVQQMMEAGMAWMGIEGAGPLPGDEAR